MVINSILSASHISSFIIRSTWVNAENFHLGAINNFDHIIWVVLSKNGMGKLYKFIDTLCGKTILW